jgi:pimeloyl-ACP methyl ester carboxylesterase
MPPAAVSAVGGYASLEAAPEIARCFRAGAVIAATPATTHSSPSLAEIDDDAQAQHADLDLYGHAQIGRRGRAGELDRIDSSAVLEAEVLSRIPQARMEVLPGTGHLSVLESPVELAAEIDRFASRLHRAVRRVG